MFKLTEIDFKGEIQRHTEVGSITFKINNYVESKFQARILQKGREIQ